MGQGPHLPSPVDGAVAGACGSTGAPQAPCHQGEGLPGPCGTRTVLTRQTTHAVHQMLVTWHGCAPIWHVGHDMTCIEPIQASVPITLSVQLSDTDRSVGLSLTLWLAAQLQLTLPSYTAPCALHCVLCRLAS